jgi:glycosyltransferase involved in cell wall biosynthesis
VKVLLVSYYAPPQGSPRSTRVARVGRALLRAGDAVQVLTVDVGGRDTRLLGWLDGAGFVRTPPGPLERRSLGRAAAPASSGDGGASGGPSRVAALADALLVPDRRVEWVVAALDPRLPLERPDVVVSFCPLFSGVLVGHRLARRWGVPHVIDYGDPWSYRPDYDLPAWRQRVDRALEARVVARATGIVLSAEPQVAAMRRVFPRAPDIRVVTNGYDPSDYPLETPTVGRSLRYLGSLYSPRLPLDAFGEALAAHPAWGSLEFYGVRDPASFPTRPAWLDERGTVDFITSLAKMQEAGALFALGNQAALQIPSKIFNYMGAGRPILALVERPDDPMTALGLGDQLVVATPDPAAVRRALDVLAERVDATFTPPAAWSWETIGPRYREALAGWVG